jgi:hypothetical protein
MLCPATDRCQELRIRRAGAPEDGLSARAPAACSVTSRSRASTGRTMYFPTRSASIFVRARTRLWTLKPLCRHERIRSPHSSRRLAWHDGQNPRVLQENVNRCSAWQSGQTLIQKTCREHAKEDREARGRICQQSATTEGKRSGSLQLSSALATEKTLSPFSRLISGPLRSDMLRGHPYRPYFRAASYIESTFSAGELSCSWWVGARA